MQINAAKNMLQLGNIEGFRFSISENILICSCCATYSALAPAAMKKGHMSVGAFKGPSRKSQLTSTRLLANIKQDMRVHLHGEWHAWSKSYEAQQQRVDKEARRAGVNVGKLVLANIKEHDSDLSFERRLALLHSHGVDIGTKQHSRKFVPQLRESMHAVLAQSIQKLLEKPMDATQQPPPFAVAADKATVFRRTGQMHGILVMINGVIHAIFASTLIAGNSTGAGLAELVSQMLTGGKPLKLDAELLRRSLTCFAFDGQYQSEHEGHVTGLAVQQHLVQTLHLNGSWLWSRWDGAHLIELGMDEVRRQITFYHDLSSLVSSVQQKYLYGKGFERVLNGARALKLRLNAVGVICTTRFCHSERKVLKSFFRNLVVFIKDLEEQRANQQDLLKVKSVTQVHILTLAVCLLCARCLLVRLLLTVAILSLPRSCCLRA